MDDFQWLEDKPPQKHHQWLKDYWLHMIAVAVIAIVLLLLLFNPASKSSTVPGASLRPAEPSNEVQMASAPSENVPKKQILIRMPDKSTKKVETTEDGTTQLAVPTTKTKPSTTLIKPATRLSAQSSASSSTSSSEATTVSEANAPTLETNTASTEAPTLGPNSTSSIPSIGNLSTPVTTVPPVNTQTETVSEKSTPVASKPVVEPITEKPAPSIAAAPATPKTVPPVEKVAPKAAPIEPKTPASKAPAPVVSQGDSALYTMLKRPASHYVIQLFGSDSEASVKSFIAKNNLSKNALYVTVWHNNQNWFIVLYGDYADRNQAQAAIQELPTAVSSNSPWPRSVQSVQEAIRQRLVREGMN